MSDHESDPSRFFEYMNIRLNVLFSIEIICARERETERERERQRDRERQRQRQRQREAGKETEITSSLISYMVHTVTK